MSEAMGVTIWQNERLRLATVMESFCWLWVTRSALQQGRAAFGFHVHRRINIMIVMSFRHAISNSVISCDIHCSHQAVPLGALLMTDGGVHGAQRLRHRNHPWSIPRITSFQQLFGGTHAGSIKWIPLHREYQVHVRVLFVFGQSAFATHKTGRDAIKGKWY